MDICERIRMLTAAEGVSGYEAGGVSRLVEDFFQAYTDRVWRDKLGSVYAEVGKDGPVVLLCAHMDEVGMIVRDIHEGGMLSVCSAAGVDPRVLPGSEVTVHGRIPVPAVIGQPAAADWTVQDVWVDTGLDPAQVRELVRIGDPVTYRVLPPLQLANGRVVCKTLDDRALVAAMMECLSLLDQEHLRCRVVFCATVQEERGAIGARLATEAIRPDLAIAIDTGHGPTPGTDAADVTPLDKLTLTMGGNIHGGIYRRLKQTAEDGNIPFQIEACMGGTGTDAWTMQIGAGGVPTGLISVPVRYMHTNTELMDLHTLQNCAELLRAFLMGIGEDWEETVCWIE